MTYRFLTTTALLAGWLAVAPGAAQAQSPAVPVQTPTAPEEPTAAPAAADPAQAPLVPERELERIKRALSRSPVVKVDDEGFRFYVEIVARQPTFAEYAKGYDFMNGPTRRGNPMTHQEFLKMVTPRDFYSSAGIKPTEVLQMAVTNWLGQALIRKAVEEMLRARNDRERDEIRARIDRELAALTAGGSTTQ